jgi:hypothetical protein
MWRDENPRTEAHAKESDARASKSEEASSGRTEMTQNQRPFWGFKDDLISSTLSRSQEPHVIFISQYLRQMPS